MRGRDGHIHRGLAVSDSCVYELIKECSVVSQLTALCRRLTTDEMAALDSASSKSAAELFGAPFETW